MLAEQPVAYGTEAVSHAPRVEVRTGGQVGVVNVATLGQQISSCRIALCVGGSQWLFCRSCHAAMLLPLGNGLLGSRLRGTCTGDEP